MIQRPSLCLSLLASLTLTALPADAADPAPAAKAAPVEIYGALPGARWARLSPNGKRLALIVPVKGRNTLVVWDLEGKEKSLAIPSGEFEPDWFVWKTDRRLVASLRFYSLRDPRRPTFDTRLIAIDADGNNARELVSAENFKTYVPQLQDKVVSLLPDDPDNILIELPAIDRSQLRPGQTTSVAQSSLTNEIKYPEVVRANINTGRLQTVVRQQNRIVAWHADAAGNARLGQTLRDKTVDYQVHGVNDSAWSSIQSFEVNRGRIFSPIAFVDNQPERLYVLSNHAAGPAALYELDTRTGTFVRTVAANPRSGIEPIEQHGRLLGYRIAHESSPVYIDDKFAAEARIINKALPDSRNDIIDRSSDGQRVLFRVARGNEPADFWLLDRSSGKQVLSPVVELYPGLEPEQIAPTRVLSYKARDGLEIPALVTVPPGYRSGAGRQPLPFVVLPHGGPTSHDVTGFNYLVQFLASRGYGVLQPQFRGSTGYGAAFEAAGLQQWGLKMQDDVTDGTHWLIEQKLADPARIAIVGASYGGYSALIGAVREAGLYRAAAAIAPVTDLNLLIETNRDFLFSDINRPRIGSDAAILEKTSPASNVDRIRIPLLLVHGRKDYTVPVAQTERMAEALSKAGKPFELVYLDEGDHYLSRADDRLATLKALEKFLASNLAKP